MKELDYQDYLEYLSLDFSAKEVQKRVKRINNLSTDLLSQLKPEILSIIDHLPLFRKSKEEKEEITKKESSKPTDGEVNEDSEESKQEKKAKQQAQKQKKKETDYELRWQKINCFISSLLEFMYISNYAEENISDFINCKYPDLFKRICVISLEDFNKLLDNKVFRDEVLNKTIKTFKNYESSSREVGKIED
ncbi:hypothetical protein AGMMS49965_24250 [Bacteroidia bacterium]|nr:hypothetical protein AGMMS49965_24250 [Bacteroidia bacterium]